MPPTPALRLLVPFSRGSPLFFYINSVPSQKFFSLNPNGNVFFSPLCFGFFHLLYFGVCPILKFVLLTTKISTDVLSINFSFFVALLLSCFRVQVRFDTRLKSRERSNILKIYTQIYSSLKGLKSFYCLWALKVGHS